MIEQDQQFRDTRDQLLKVFPELRWQVFAGAVRGHTAHETETSSAYAVSLWNVPPAGSTGWSVVQYRSFPYPETLLAGGTIAGASLADALPLVRQFWDAVAR